MPILNKDNILHTRSFCHWMKDNKGKEINRISDFCKMNFGQNLNNKKRNHKQKKGTFNKYAGLNATVNCLVAILSSQFENYRCIQMSLV